MLIVPEEGWFGRTKHCTQTYEKNPTLYLTLPKKISFNRFNEDPGEYRVVLVSDFFPV